MELEEHNITLLEQAKQLQRLSPEQRQAVVESIVNLELQSSVQSDTHSQQFLIADRKISQLRAQVSARTGFHPDSVPLIRQLREGTSASD